MLHKQLGGGALYFSLIEKFLLNPWQNGQGFDWTQVDTSAWSPHLPSTCGLFQPRTFFESIWLLSQEMVSQLWNAFDPSS